MCRHSEAMGGGTLDCVGGTQSLGAANNYSPQQPQPRIKRSLSLSWFYCNAPESDLSEVLVFDHALRTAIIRYAPGAVGQMEMEHLIRYSERAVGLKPSAMECEARLRGLKRIIY